MIARVGAPCSRPSTEGKNLGMFWKLFEKFVGLLVLLALLSAGAQVAMYALSRLASSTGGLLPEFVRSVLWTGLIGVFGIGLLVRFWQWLLRRDLDAWRRTRAQEHRARLAPRPPTEDVPSAFPPVRVPPDPDPALPFEEEPEE